MSLNASSSPLPPSHDRFCLAHNLQSMPTFRPLPQELVDKIIDELGEDYRNPKIYFRDRIAVREVLRACSLVSKNWTSRSRAQLFKAVNVGTNRSGSFLIPPRTIMPYITKLEILSQRKFPSPDVLTAFYVCPIVYLGFAMGTFTAARASIVKFITTISATLQTVKFKDCSLPLRLIHDIMLAHLNLKQLYFDSCKIESTNSYPPTTTHLGASHSTGLELGFFATLDSEAHICLMGVIAKSPIKCCRLNFNYKQRSDMALPANALIEANAESLSSLTVSFIDSKSKGLSQKKILLLTIKPYCSGV